MDSLLRALTTDLTLDLPDRCVIEQVLYTPKANDSIQCKVTDKNLKRTVVTISNESGTLIVTLRTLRKEFGVRNHILVSQDNATLSFSKEEVLNFVNDVNDTNYIHRKAPFVIPGLLILKTVYNKLAMNRDIQSLTIRYHAPMIVGDCVHLVTDGCICGYAEDTLLFRISLE